MEKEKLDEGEKKFWVLRSKVNTWERAVFKCVVLFCWFARNKLRVKRKVEVEDPESERRGKLWIYVQFEDQKVVRLDKLLEGLSPVIA